MSKDSSYEEKDVSEELAEKTPGKLWKITSQVTYVTLVPRGNETLRRNARGTPSALSSSESYV